MFYVMNGKSHPASFCCGQCGETFTTENLRDRHTRIEHQVETTFVVGKRRFSVTKDEESNSWICPQNCGKRFKMSQGLSRHIRSCLQGIGDTTSVKDENEDEDEEMLIIDCWKKCTGSSLITLPSFQPAGLIFNSKYAITICLSCAIILADVSLESHLLRVHKVKW